MNLIRNFLIRVILILKNPLAELNWNDKHK